MGYLTTFTVYNDGCGEIPKHPEEFAQKIYEGCLDHEISDKGLGSHANLIHVQRCRHADDHTIYVHMGNCVTEVNPYSPEFAQLAQKCPEFADKLVRFLEDELKQLRKYKIDRRKKVAS
jgi:hypothetical protein